LKGVFKTDPELAGLRCRCGADLHIGEDDQGRPGVVHAMPLCEAFKKIDHPADFLKYVRTGVRTDLQQ